MARDYKQIASNVATLVEKDAPDELINRYLGSQGLTFSQFKDVLEGPTLVGQAKEFVKGIPAGFIGTLGTAAEGAAALLPESLEKPVVEKTRKAVQALTPEVTPGYEDTVGRELGQAVGSVGSFLVPGAVGGKALGALGMGTRAAGTLVSGGFGAAAGAGEARQRAEMEGATPEEKSQATALGMLPGALEALPTARLLRFVEPAKQAISKIPEGITQQLLHKGADVLATAGIEGAQEWAQGLGQNMIAQGIYKPDQKLMEGLSKDAAYGAGAGAIAEVFMDMILGKKGMNTRENLYNKLKNQPESVPAGAVGALEDIANTEDQARRAAHAAELKAIELRSIQERGGFEGSQAYAELSAQVEALQEKARVANEKADAKKLAFQQSAFHEAQPDLLGDVLAPKQEAAPTVEPPAAPVTQPGQMELPLEDQQSLALNAPPQPVNLQQPVQQQAAPVQGRPVTVEDIKAMGIGGGPNVGIKQAILGKDLTDPKQAAEVKAALENYASGDRSARIIKGVENFLNTAPFLEQQKLNLRRPYGSMKKAGVETALTPEEQASLQDELNAELNQEPQSLENQNAGKLATSIGGPSESSVRVPSNGPTTTTGAGPTERRGMVPVGNVIGQPIGGEAPVQRALTEEAPAKPILLEPANTALTKDQANNYREAAANYLEKANYIGQRALENLAGDLYARENLTDANRFYKGLSEAQKGFVQKKLDELNKWERRGTSYKESFNKKQKAEKAFKEELDQDENPKVKRELTEQQKETLEIGKERQALYDKFSPKLKGFLDKYIEAFKNALYVDQGRYAGKEGQSLKIKEGRAASVYEKAFKEEFPNSKISAESIRMFVSRQGRFESFDSLLSTKLERVDAGKTTEKLITAVQRGDLAGALNAIKDDTSNTFNILEKLVSKRLLANKGSLPKIEIVPVGTIKGGEAQYNPFTDTVQIHEGQVDSHTVLHETVHGFLHTLIERFEAGAKNKGIAGLKDLYDFIKENHPNLAEQYGMKNLTEFASELMSNRDFQEELKKIPYRTENQSLFTRFIRDVLEALGLSPTQKLSALARGMMAADQAIAQGRAVQEMRTGVETGPVVKALGNDLGLVDKTTAGFTPLRLDTILDEYAYTRPSESDLGKGYIGYVSPDDFLKATTTSPEELARIEKESFGLDQEKLANAYPGIRLDIGKDFSLWGHEGRHRMVALRNAGIKKVPVIFRVGESSKLSDVERKYIPPQKFYSDLYGQAGFYARDLIPINYDNKNRLAEEFGAKEGQVAFLKRGESDAINAEKDLAAMGNITNEKAKAPEKGLLGKVTAFAMDPAYRQDAIDRFRTQVTYKGASVESKLKREFDNAIRDELGELRPDVLALQAEHSDNLVSQAIMKGGLDIDKESGLWQAVDKEQTLANTFKHIAALGERLGSQDLAYELANKTFIGKRAGGIQRDNEQKQKDADIAAAKGNKLAAQKLRDSTVYVHATKEQIAAAEAAYDKYPELQAAFKEFTDFKNGLVDTMVKAGRLTREEAADWKSKIDYVPWNRIKEYEDKIQASPKSYFKGLVNLGQLGRLSGSDDQINNVFDNMVGLSFWMGNTAIRNYAAVKMADALTKIDAQEIKPGMPITDPTKVIYVYKEGIPHVYQLGTAADVYAFKGIESVGGPMLEGFASLSNVLRKGTTAMPAFAVSQLFQDSYRAMLLSGVKSPLKIPFNVLKNFGGELMGDDLSKHLSSFGIIGAYDLVPNKAKDEIEKQLGIKRRGITESILNKFEAFSLASDAAQRRAIYEQTLKETGDQALALYRAQEIINFKRQGANRTIGVLRQIVPFFNAYLQGMDVLARTMAGTGISGKEKGEAIKLFAATAAKLTALSFIYSAMVAGDDEYEKLRGFERDKNFIIPGTGLKIPVAQEVGFLFKIVPERIYHYITTQGTARPDDAKRTMIELRDGLLDAFGGPNLTPQAVKPALEIMVNRSFFTQSPIVGRGMENREAYLQFTNNTSEIAKLIGKATNTSPLKWDHFIKGYTGVAGGTALGMTDYIASSATGIDRPDRRVYELPQFRTFMYNKVGGGDKEDFYSLRDEVRRTVDTVNALKADGRIQELQDYIKDPDKFGLYMLKSSINGIEQRLEDIRKYKKVISADNRMDGSKKKDLLERFENTENALIQAFNLPKLTEFARSFG